MASGLTEKQASLLKQRLHTRFAELKDAVRQELVRSDDERYIELAGRVHDTGDRITSYNVCYTKLLRVKDWIVKYKKGTQHRG